MFKSNINVRIELNERAIVFRDGLPHRALEPGRYRLGRDEEVALRFDIDAIVFDVRPEVRRVLPTEWFTERAIAAHQRGVLFREGRPDRVLGPGLHRHWTFDPTVRLEVLAMEVPPPTDPRVRALLGDAVVELTVAPRERVVVVVDGRPDRVLKPGLHRYWKTDATTEILRFSVQAPPPDDARVLALLKDEVVQVLVGQHQRGLLFVQGRLERVLEPGRHLAWNTGEAPTSVSMVDMRHQTLNIQGQELMTKDKVSLRLSVAAEWAPRDPAEVQRVASDPAGSLYTLVQLALREFVAGVTLDELLEGRDALTRFLEGRVGPDAEQIGIRVHRVGVKDVILPGEMKALFNRVIEAEKQAQANAILRREEAAVVRNQANAAQLMAERPAMLRLKELEALEKIAGRIGELKIVLGQAGLEKLLTGPGQ
ncbi:MAG: slipin family protein [bacterium]